MSCTTVLLHNVFDGEQIRFSLLPRCLCTIAREEHFTSFHNVLAGRGNDLRCSPRCIFLQANGLRYVLLTTVCFPERKSVPQRVHNILFGSKEKGTSWARLTRRRVIFIFFEGNDVLSVKHSKTFLLKHHCFFVRKAFCATVSSGIWFVLKR